jgi:YVTN family beta-propeller protein
MEIHPMHLPNMMLLVVGIVTVVASAQQPASSTPKADQPLRAVQTIALPAEIKGSFDHFEIDTKRNRLFATPEDFKAVLVLDLATNKLIHQITGIERPHAVLYRPDNDRLYITDGGDGSVKVFDADTYKMIDRIPLLKDADSIGYDISRKYLYVDNGGGDVHESFSMLSVIDTSTDRKIAEIKIDGDTLEAMALDNYRPRLYVNDKAKNTVVVIDRLKNTIVANWPITLGKSNVAMALDEERQRLFVACRDGHVVVLDTNTGIELQALPITQGVDDLIYDARSRRLYAIGGGQVDIFDQLSLDKYVARGSVLVGAKARTGKLSPTLNRLFVAAPQDGPRSASVHIFEPINATQGEAAPSGIQKPVDAPAAQALILETLSAHPFLRRMGLHVIPPGQTDMILIANGNATRLGILTAPSDFAATKGGKTYGPLIADGAFYNMKMPMFDAQRRPIGILVMEIPATSARSEADAARQAEEIRQEVAGKIPSLEWLFKH